MISPKVYATENSPEEFRDMEEAREKLQKECEELSKSLALELGYGIDYLAFLNACKLEVIETYYDTPGFWYRIKQRLEDTQEGLGTLNDLKKELAKLPPAKARHTQEYFNILFGDIRSVFGVGDEGETELAIQLRDQFPKLTSEEIGALVEKYREWNP